MDAVDHSLVLRGAIAEAIKGVAKAILAPALETGGKLNPAQNAPGSRKLPEDEEKDKKDVVKSIYVPIEITKAEERTVTGVVLQPEVVDAQGDILSKKVIESAAHKFLGVFNANTKLGIQHKSFNSKQLTLLESFIAPMEFVLGTKTVKAGSWIMKVRVEDLALWKKVKDGQITGFSIGGIAKVKELKQS